MRLCRFAGDRLGVIEGDTIRDVTYAAHFDRQSWPVTPGDPLIERLPEVLSQIAGDVGPCADGDRVVLAGAALESVVTAPSKIMAAPANYSEHVARDTLDPAVDAGVHRAALDGLAAPVESLGLFLKATSSLAGPATGIAVDDGGRRTDYEVELAVVLGRRAHRVPAAAALEYVAGYCVGLDMSVRGKEDRSFRKSRDTFTVLGPWLTTADEVGDPSDLTLWLSLNGEERQRSSTAAMTVGIPRLIELASAQYTLHPGDVLLTGTPEGVGPVSPGDTIVAGGDRIGEMTVEVHR